MLDGLVSGLVDGGLTKLIGGLIFKDDIINSLLTGLYGAIEVISDLIDFAFLIRVSAT